MPIRAIPEVVKLVAALGIGAAILFGIQTVLDWKDAAAQNEQRGRTMQAASGIIEDGQRADQDRTNTDAGIAQGRNDYDSTYEEAKRNEPETAARADRSVPVGVRESFRARRLARERSGCVGRECDSRPAADAAAER